MNTDPQLREILELLYARTKSRDARWKLHSPHHVSLSTGSASVILKHMGSTSRELDRMQFEILNDAGDTVVLQVASEGERDYNALRTLLETIVAETTRKDETIRSLIDDLRAGKLPKGS